MVHSSRSFLSRLGLFPRSVYIAFEVFPRPKGASSHIAGMVQGLARGHAPVLLLCLGFVDMPAFQVEGDIIIHRFRVYHPNLLRRAEEFGNFVYHALAALEAAPEVVMFRDPWSGFPALHAAPDSRSVFEVNALPRWELPYSYPAYCRNAALQVKIEAMERFCLERSNAVITVSDVTRDAVSDLGVAPEKLFIVPNSADEVFFSPAPEAAEAEPGEPSRWFGYVGSLHPWQGLETALSGWAEVAAEWPEVGFEIIHHGRREQVKELRRVVRRLELEAQVRFCGPFPPDRVAQTFQNWEFSLAPLAETSRNTVQGCCPVKVVESMAAGTPVVASDLRVTRSLICDGSDGILVPPGDVRSWALAMDALLRDGAKRNRLAVAARRSAEKRFTRERMFDTLDSVLSWLKTQQS